MAIVVLIYAIIVIPSLEINEIHVLRKQATCTENTIGLVIDEHHKVVTRRKRKSRWKEDRYMPVIQYYVDGKEIQVDEGMYYDLLGLEAFHMHIGDKINVHYNLYNPTQFYLPHTLDRDYMTYLPRWKYLAATIIIYIIYNGYKELNKPKKIRRNKNNKKKTHKKNICKKKKK